MKKYFIYLVVLFISLPFYAQETTIKEFNSDELSTVRLLKIYVPKSYEDSPDRMYPLTIILDSEFLFDVYVANAKLFANKDKAPEQIIVGIVQNQKRERYEDCAYNKITSMPTEKSTHFYRFIRNEVLNYMDVNYRISPFKSIVGNTLTANFINYFLIEEDPAFNAYVNLNPSYALDINAMLHSKIPTIENNTFYYIISGEYNGTKKHELIKNVDALLKTSQNENFDYRYDEINNATIVSSIGQGISNSLAFVFDQFSAISKEEYKKKIAHMSPPDAIEYLEKKYVDIEYLFGANIKIREKDIFAIEGIIMDKEDGDYLEEFGKMINRLYPESPIGDYYIGKYYESGNFYKKALKYYKNGYAKMSNDNPNKDGYYQNVERVLTLQKEEITDKIKFDKLEKEEKKEEKATKTLEKEEKRKRKEIEKEKKKAAKDN
ncbi:MAG: hypothetical protein L3J23_00200 [Flavobacteriaceae bacterium]|nr:hypothetical protein [Flavobacteriaceae bacterium]